ncbi:MAG: hypothetical protein ICV73_30630 [Acetobacteraceae bacterium]|nr:hypothetical protein [Acetobacteraceae bacterium]
MRHGPRGVGRDGLPGVACGKPPARGRAIGVKVLSAMGRLGSAAALRRGAAMPMPVASTGRVEREVS